MYFDEDLVLDLRLNLLDKYVDYFVIVESKYNHKGESKKLNFNIQNYKKFEKKIIYLVFDQEPSDLYKFEKKDTQPEVSSKYIFNAGKRENGQRNFISQGLKNASSEDIIIISDLDEIPNLTEINFKTIKNEIIIFRHDMFYYKFNLKLPNYKWTGSKACRMKNLKSPQWLRNIKDKKFGFYRIDTFFSDTKYRNLSIIENGGSISHHHGVGKLRKDFIPDTISKGSIDLIKDMKSSRDPKNIFGVRNNIFSDQ